MAELRCSEKLIQIEVNKSNSLEVDIQDQEKILAQQKIYIDEQSSLEIDN